MVPDHYSLTTTTGHTKLVAYFSYNFVSITSSIFTEIQGLGNDSDVYGVLHGLNDDLHDVIDIWYP
jgi:hypothetical protein